MTKSPYLSGKQRLPRWATPERLALLERFQGAQCAQGEADCPVLTWFGQEMRRRLGEPGANPQAWLFRAALATPAVLKTIPDRLRMHLPFYFRKEMVAVWKEDTREEHALLAKLERAAMFRSPDRKGWGRRFDPIRKATFMEQQARMYIERLGVSGLTFTRIARVRVPSSHQRLFVDVADSKPASKNQRRKAARYGLPIHEERAIDDLCRLAVQDFQARL